jgi:hypothetical protein
VASDPLGGSVSGGGIYPYNTQVTLKASTNDCYTFANWTSNGIVLSVNDTFVLMVTMNSAIVANFIPDTFTVVVSPNYLSHGSVSGGGRYPCNASVSLTAIANQGYEFEHWISMGDIISTDNPFTFRINRDMFVIAGFNGNVGIEEADNVNSSIYVFPNPAQDVLNISGLSGSEDVALTDISGRILYTAKSDGAREIQIQVSNLARGMYFVRISTTTKVKTMKIIKE